MSAKQVCLRARKAGRALLNLSDSVPFITEYIFHMPEMKRMSAAISETSEMNTPIIPMSPVPPKPSLLKRMSLMYERNISVNTRERTLIDNAITDSFTMRLILK